MIGLDLVKEFQQYRTYIRSECNPEILCGWVEELMSNKFK